MSILIKGMKMPKNCDDCYVNIDCPYDESQDGYKMMGGRPRKCPLVPVPPHGRLIDADAVAKMVLDSVNQEDAQGFMFTKIICQILKDAPTIIPADPAEEG